jgi:hypothetical protein
MTLLAASNSGLIAGMIFGIIFFIIFTIITIKRIIILIKQKDKNETIDNLFYIVLGIAFCHVGAYITLLEYNILTNYENVDGITIGYCELGDPPSKAIKFEYIFNGQSYTNCNSCDQIDAIEVPGGKFKVRVSDFEPSYGRMDFDKPLTLDSKE